MGQLGYEQCGCCGNLYKDDGSEADMYWEDHWVKETFWNSNPWWLNVGRNWRYLFTGEWKYYYCNLLCFLSDQRLCKGIKD